jgi:hypothetical protein
VTHLYKCAFSSSISLPIHISAYSTLDEAKMSDSDTDQLIKLMAQMIVELSKDYEIASRLFRTTAYASYINDTIKANAETFAALENVVIMGLGSPPNLWQLAFAKFIVHSLITMGFTKKSIPIVAQDPCFQFSDRIFLAVQGVEVLQYVERLDDDRPRGYSDTDKGQFDWERSEIQPAASLITEQTLFFAPNLPWVVTARVLFETDPAIYIGGSMEQLIRSNRWLAKEAVKNGVDAYEEQYLSNIEAGKQFGERHVWIPLPAFDHPWDMQEEVPDNRYGDLSRFIMYKRKGDGACEGWNDGPVPLPNDPVA